MSIPFCNCSHCGTSIKKENGKIKGYSIVCKQDCKQEDRFLCNKCIKTLVEMYRQFSRNAQAFKEKFNAFLERMSQHTKITIARLYAIAEARA